MVNVCCILNCTSVSAPSSGVVFYSFPKDEVLKKLWFKKIGKTNYLSKPIMICNRHFQTSDFVNGTKRLTSAAIPSIDLSLPSTDNCKKDNNEILNSKPASASKSNEPAEENSGTLTNSTSPKNKNLRVVIQPSKDGRHHMAKLVYLSNNPSENIVKPSADNLRKILPKIPPAAALTKSIHISLPSQTKDIKCDENDLSVGADELLDSLRNKSLPNIDDLSDVSTENDSLSLSDSDSVISDVKNNVKKLKNNQLSKTTDSILKTKNDITNLKTNSGSIKADVDLGECSGDANTSADLKFNVSAKRKLSEGAPEQNKPSSDKKLKNELPTSTTKTTINSSFENNSSNLTGINNATNKRYGDPYVLLAPPNGEPFTCYLVSQSSANLNQYLVTGHSSFVSPTSLSTSTASGISNQALLTKVPPGVQAQSLSQSNIKPFKPDVTIHKVSNTPNSNGQLAQLEKKYNCTLDMMKNKLGKRRKTVKALCQKIRRLTKNLETCKSNLNNSKSKYLKLESESFAWNNNNMSDLGKLIYSLHACKAKRSQPLPIPPEVKGFVISLFLTSPRAYLIVRDCFNSLPHPKTITRWLDKVDEQPKDRIRPTPSRPSVEETFTPVVESPKQNEHFKRGNALSQENITSNIIVPIINGIGVSSKKNTINSLNNETPLGIVPKQLTMEGNIIPEPKLNTENCNSKTELNVVRQVSIVNEPTTQIDFETLNESSSVNPVEEELSKPNEQVYTIISESQLNTAYDIENVESNAMYNVEDVTEGATIFNVEGVEESTVLNVEGLSKDKAVYFVMDEHGNVTGELCDAEGIVFCSEGFTDDDIDPTEVPQHEVVIE